MKLNSYQRLVLRALATILNLVRALDKAHEVPNSYARQVELSCHTAYVQGEIEE